MDKVTGRFNVILDRLADTLIERNQLRADNECLKALIREEQEMNQNEEKALDLLRQWQSATKTFYAHMDSAKYTDSSQAREAEERRAGVSREAAWTILKQLEKVEL